MDFSLLRSEKPPSTLYHYTSLEVLVAIVQSRKLRASSIRFLNDSSESLWLKEHIFSVLRNQASTYAEHDRIARIIAEVQSLPPQSHFVASFTEKADDLSQWRAYCPSGLGVSIGFASECLQEQWIANPRGDDPYFLSTSLQKMQYYSESNKPDLEQAVATLLKGDIKAATESISLRVSEGRGLTSLIGYSPESVILLGNLCSDQLASDQEDRERRLQSLIPAWVSLTSPFFKHHAFEAEAEWRKLISKDHRPMPGQQFRQGKSTLIPFVDIELDSKTELSERVQQTVYFVNEVVIGPTPTPELTVEAVRALFASEGHPEVVVRPSSIPFRSW